MVDIHNLKCKATVTHSETHMTRVWQVCSEEGTVLYSYNCEAFRAHLEMRSSETSVHITIIKSTMKNNNNLIASPS